MDFSFAVIFIYAVILGLVAPYITAHSEKYGVLLPPTIALVTGSALWSVLTWLGMGYTDAWIWIIVMVAMPIVMMRAADLGKSGYETAVELDADRALMERMEAVRRQAEDAGPADVLARAGDCPQGDGVRCSGIQGEVVA